MEIDRLKNLLDEFGDNVRFEHDLKKKNWFNIGGKTKIFFKADNLKDLSNFLKKLNNKEKIFILGAGSNTLISDDLFFVFLGLSSPGKGLLVYAGTGCIAYHLTKDYKPTAGCVALKEKDFLIMLKLIRRNSKIKIY